LLCVVARFAAHAAPARTVRGTLRGGAFCDTPSEFGDKITTIAARWCESRNRFLDWRRATGHGVMGFKRSDFGAALTL
jgi:hypothetical protein